MSELARSGEVVRRGRDAEAALETSARSLCGSLAVIHSRRHMGAHNPPISAAIAPPPMNASDCRPTCSYALPRTAVLFVTVVFHSYFLLHFVMPVSALPLDTICSRDSRSPTARARAAWVKMPTSVRPESPPSVNCVLG